MIEIDYIVFKDELTKLAPNLAKLSKPTQQVPDGYFSRVEEEIIRQIEIFCAEDLSVQEVPEDYFVSLEGRIMDTISADEPNESVQTPILRFLFGRSFRYAMAGVLVLTIAMVVLLKLPDLAEGRSEMVDAEQEAYFNYLHTNAIDIDLNYLIDQDILIEQDLSFISEVPYEWTENMLYIPESNINF